VDSIDDIEALEAPAATPAPKKAKRAVEPHAEAEKIPLPVFNSLNQCATCSDIPLAIIRQAKRAGCNAFKAHRVDLKLLLKWLFAQDEQGVDWGDRLKKVQFEREEIKLLKDKSLVVSKADVSAGIGKGVSILFGELEKSIQALPPALKGLTEAEIQQRLTVDVDKYKESVRLALSEITRQPVTVDTK
jgi:hypothetical protein